MKISVTAFASIASHAQALRGGSALSTASKPRFLSPATWPRAVSGVIAGVLLLSCLSGCVSRTTTAETVWRDQQIARQQAADKPQTPDDKGLYLSLIQQMQDKQLYYASLAHIDAFEQKFGQGGDIELLRANALRETGQPAAAIAVYQLWTKGATAAAAEHGIGRALIAQHDNRGALEALSRAATLDPTNAAYLNDLAYARLVTGDVSGARIPVAQAAELAPEDRKVIANLALYLLVSGQAARADAVFAKAKMSPHAEATTRSLAASLASQTGTPASVEPSARQVSGTASPMTSVGSGPDAGTSAGGDGRGGTSLALAPGTKGVAVRVSAADSAVPAVSEAAVGWQTGSVLQRFGETR